MAVKKETGVSYTDIVKDVKAGKFAQIYCLMGDEDYYIDKVSEYILQQALSPEEHDFNYTLLYGGETRANDVINVARQFPMMAERRVVMVREFQAMADKEMLASYAKNPCPTTVLVLCHKHGTLDKRRSLASELKKTGVLFESKRLYDNQLPGFVNNYMQQRHLTMDNYAVQMLCEHVGSDLTRLATEMDKLILALSNGETRVGVKLVEELTGMSKDYNVFELQNALALRNVYKANEIVKYFNSNPKSFAMAPVLASLFGFFSDVLLAYFSPDSSDESIAAYTGKNLWVARQALIPARRAYSGKKVLAIISEIRQIDAKSKGVGGCKTPPGELLRELIYFILH